MSNHPLGFFTADGCSNTTNVATGLAQLTARGLVATLLQSAYGVRIANCPTGYGKEFELYNNSAASSAMNLQIAPLNFVDTVVVGAWLRATNSVAGPTRAGITITTSTGLFMYFGKNANGTVHIDGTLLSGTPVTFPSLSGNETSCLEIVYTPTSINFYENNSLVTTYTGTYPTAKFSHIRSQRGSAGSSHNFVGVSSVYWGGTTRLGMVRPKLAALSTPSVDTSASVTGAASRQLALASFDADTSHVTYTGGSGQKTSLPISASVPAGAIIHGISLCASARGDGDAADGKLFITDPDGTQESALAMAPSYAATTAVFSSDSLTNPFDVADLLAGDIEVGIEEGV